MCIIKFIIILYSNCSLITIEVTDGTILYSSYRISPEVPLDSGWTRYHSRYRYRSRYRWPYWRPALKFRSVRQGIRSADGAVDRWSSPDLGSSPATRWRHRPDAGSPGDTSSSPCRTRSWNCFQKVWTWKKIEHHSMSCQGWSCANDHHGWKDDHVPMIIKEWACVNDHPWMIMCQWSSWMIMCQWSSWMIMCQTLNMHGWSCSQWSSWI